MTDRFYVIHQSILSDVLIRGAEAYPDRGSRMHMAKQVIPDDRLLHFQDVQANNTYKLNPMYKLILSRLETPGAIAEALNIEGNMAFYDNRVDH